MDAKQARDLANAFGLAALRCQEARPRIDGKVEMLIAPAIVCAAFSVEVAFKALLISAGASGHGHNLKDLFNGLAADVRAAIVTTVGVPQSQFEADLADAARTFDEWRYLFEGRSVQSKTSFLFGLVNAANLEVSRRVKYAVLTCAPSGVRDSMQHFHSSQGEQRGDGPRA